MFVIKRNGNREPVNFEKIHTRITRIRSSPINLSNVNDVELAQTVIQSLRNGIHTSEIDIYTSNIAASLSTVHTDYGVLASRISMNNHHKNTLNTFTEKAELLYNRKPTQFVTDEFIEFVRTHSKAIETAIDYSRDYLIDFFGLRTLENGYMLSLDGKVIERPQDMFMRVAIQLRQTDGIENVLKVYENMSKKYYTHATPTLFNSGTMRPNLSSCFLLSSQDSIEGIMKTLTDSTHISKWSGGIGFHMSMWRSTGARINGTNGKSSGIVPFLRLFNQGARAFNQGGKRLGSFAAYLEPHHPDVMEFLQLRRPQGDENLRCRDLFIAMWISDLFMERVFNDEEWSLFCPSICPDLNSTDNDEYRELYLKYESEGKAKSKIPARDIWRAIFDSQKESGMPYILYKDSANRNSMQQNLGTISSSNLCAEIILYSDENETAVCNLASICLPQFVEDSDNYSNDFPKSPILNYRKLAEIVGEIVLNLNNVIDSNWNPVIEAARSNFKHRPIGIGVQGLADVFLKMRIPFESDKARDVNKKIFETIYYSALSKSSEISRNIYRKAYTRIIEHGEYLRELIPEKVLEQYPKLESDWERYTCLDSLPKTIGTYPSYLNGEGSPLSQGKFHFELFGETELSGMYDWESLRKHIEIYGVRNSQLIALMPTASTSQIMGSSSCFEPYLSNIFKRKTLAGEFIIINKYLINDLQNLGLWNDEMKQLLLANDGSIQNIEGLPTEMKELYKTAWEIKQRSIIDLSADRQAFVDQSQSMNLYLEEFTFDKFNSMQFYAWRKGLKTGCYYLRSRPAISPQKFTLDPEMQSKAKSFVLPKNRETDQEIQEECLMCSS